jgi:hypothetical protein
MSEWENLTSGPGRLYSAAEKKKLIRRLLASKDKLTWSTLHDHPGISGRIPSRRTLYRIFNDPDNIRIRDATARQIETLLGLLQEHDTQTAPKLALSKTAGAALRRVSSTSREKSREFLEHHAGCFKCIRLTTRSRQILVTHLRVFEQAGGFAGFEHVESIPDEASDLPDRPYRTLVHQGFVLLNDRLVHFLAPYPAMRQLSCVTSSNQQHPTMSGILLTQDATRGFPFAARVFVVKTTDIEASELPASRDYGLFALDDENYGPYLRYIRNSAAADSVLFPETEI